MSYANNVQGGAGARPSWQDQLQEHCRSTKMNPPVFNIVSDRRDWMIPVLSFPSQSADTQVRSRCPTVCFECLACRHCRRSGVLQKSREKNAPALSRGRTAWSSTVTVQGQNIAARYWYDGQYINNAKEDAAEVALKTLNQQPRSSTVFPGQLYTQQPATAGYGRGAGGF
ncbi:unnamed protein product [Penicillium olsonii]|uniref:Uncharacterized protein n=1 Tax=Penicillium olsonii TaxID=99116 RepID=A0A9W4HKJ5_PENOL|nr:unnamed protein product [Penicillium olsonii]CAG8046476.1 unnamed protein product [Penicillium olsonii]